MLELFTKKDIQSTLHKRKGGKIVLKEEAYRELQKDRRAYEIMLLRDQQGKTFTDIAKEYEISSAWAVQKYNRLKTKQIRLYINHIAAVLGHESTSQVENVFQNAYECYQDWTYACAYLEKRYKDILMEYRDGEPGMPTQFIKNMPPFKPKLSKKTVARVIELREAEKASFVTIAKELRMTQAKARHTYEMFYHKQVIALIKALQEKAESKEEKAAIWNYYFGRYHSSKKRYDMLTKE